MAPPGAAAFAYHQLKRNESTKSSSPASRRSYSSPYDVHNFRQATEEYRSNPKTALSALQYNVQNFDSLPPSLKSNIEFLCEVIKRTHINPSALSASLLKDRAIAIAFVSKDAKNLASLTDWQDDEEIVQIAITKSWRYGVEVLQNISPRLQKTSSVVMNLLNSYSSHVEGIFKHLVTTNNPLKRDPEIISLGIKKDGTGRVFSLLDPDLQREKKYALAAVEALHLKGGLGWRFRADSKKLFLSLDDSLKQDKDVVLSALKSYPLEIFPLISSEMKSQKVFALAAINHLWLTRRKKEQLLRDMPPMLQMDDEILEAVFAHSKPKELCCDDEKGCEDSYVDRYCCCLCNTISDRFNKMMYRKRAVEQISNSSLDRPLSCEMGESLLKRNK